MKKNLLMLATLMTLIATGCTRKIVIPPSSKTSTSISYDFQTYYINVLECKNGKVDILSQCKSGLEVIGNVTPSIEGYELRSVSIHEEAHNFDIDPVMNGNNFSFIMPNGNVSIKILCTIIDPLPEYQKTPIEKEYESKGYKSAITDSLFKKGFAVRKSQNVPQYMFNKTLDPYDWGMKPNWHISQWMTDYEINPDTGSYYEDKVSESKRKYSSGPSSVTNAKTLTMDSSNGNFSLECNCEFEYEGGTKIPKSITYGNDWWVHYLIEQELVNPVHVVETSSIYVDLKYQVTNCDKIKAFYKDSCEFYWYITVQNKNVKSEYYDTFVWFGLNLFQATKCGQVDPGDFTFEFGSNVALYRPTSKDYLKGGTLPNVGDVVEIKIDIWNYIMTVFTLPAFKAFWGTTQLEDLYIGATNIGYEVPGMYNINANIDHVGLFYK